MSEIIRCAHCGEVIGVYEPLIVLEGSGPRLTSRAAEPASDGDGDGTVRYHDACHEALSSGGAAPGEL
jgi:hypothetical protein